MDIADEADAYIERERTNAMKALSLRLANQEVFTGFCCWCGDPIESPKRWCNAECAEDHEHFKKRKQSWHL